MKILTLDLSTKSSGWCIGTEKGLLKHGCFVATQKNPIKRIINIREQIKNLLKENKVKKVIMEQVRPEYNSHTNKVLMWLQAAIVIVAYEIDSNIECQFIGASTWRAAIKIKQGPGIKRSSLKQKDIQYVENKYKIKVKNDDQADAICIFDAYFINQDNEINWG